MVKMGEDRESKTKLKPVTAGCVVTWADLPIVVISITCFAAFIIYGASNAALGASVPALSRNLHKSEARIGFIFIFRGLGFLGGTLGSAKIVTIKNFPVSMEQMTCLASVVMGIPTFFISFCTSYYLVLALSIVQGVGFGGIDCISNCIFPELWGTRIQPWMQALHLMFGVGAMIGPALVGYQGFEITYRVLGACSIIPWVGLMVYRFLSSMSGAITKNPSSSDQEIEMSSYGHVSTTVSEDDDEVTFSPLSRRSSGVGHDEEFRERGGGAAGGGIVIVDMEEGSGAMTGTDSEGEEQKEAGNPVTFTLRMLILVFYFLYTGTEAGYAGWLPVYLLADDLTATDSQAAYASATFWATMTIGRVLAVFTAIAFSATFMLRFHLTCTMACAVMFMFVKEVGTFHFALVTAALNGLALSAIYPLVMTIVLDYGYTMDSKSTTLFMVGAMTGEAGLPMAIGLLIEFFGPESLPWTVLMVAVGEVLTYLCIHLIASGIVGSGSSSSSSGSAGGDAGELRNLKDISTHSSSGEGGEMGDDRDEEGENAMHHRHPAHSHAQTHYTHVTLKATNEDTTTTDSTL